MVQGTTGNRGHWGGCMGGREPIVFVWILVIICTNLDGLLDVAPSNPSHGQSIEYFVSQRLLHLSHPANNGNCGIWRWVWYGLGFLTVICQFRISTDQ